MAQKKKIKTRYIDINVNPSGFVSKFFRVSKKHDFSDIALLRNILSNEKARILYTLKRNKPKSIYELAKILKRDFKSVREDVKILEKFGFIEFHSGKTGKRESLIPKLSLDKMQIIVNI
jgi:predicted transcriptional regulator